MARSVGLTTLGIGFLLWLLWTPNPRTTDRRRIESRLGDGTIGVLNSSERDFFSGILQGWAKQAGIDDQVLLDQPFKGEGLHVFSTTGAAQDLTENPAGNGLYNPRLDAIFLDEALFRTPTVAHLYADIVIRPHQADQRTFSGYLLFVFLHELGHRTLHRSVRIDSRRDKEREADEFAAAVLQKVAWNENGGPARPDLSTPFLLTDRTHGTTDPWVYLAGTIFETTYILMHSQGAYSPFRRGDLHPAFIERASGLVDAATVRTAGSTEDQFIHLARESITRIRQTLLQPLQEVHTAFPIGAAGFSGGDLVILESENGKLGGEHRIQIHNLQSQACGQPACVVDWNPSHSQPRQDGPDARFARILSTDDSVLDVSNGVGDFRANDDHWNVLSENPSVRIPTMGAVHIVPEGRPSPESWRVMSGSRVLGIIRRQFLEDSHVSARARETVTFSPIAASPNKVSFLVENDHRPRGVITSDVNGKAATYTAWRTEDPELPPGPVWPEQVSLCDDSKIEEGYIALAAGTDENTRAGAIPRAIEVWRLSPRRSPERVASGPMWIDAFDGPATLDQIQWVSIPIIRVGTVREPPGLLINIHLDSVYFFDCRTRTLELVFHPGGLVHAIGPKGEVAFYAEGGYKVFVKSLGSETKEHGTERGRR
jgi:hypothetical protein